MKAVYLLEYLNAILLYPGVFDSEEQAMAWVDQHHPDNRRFYEPIRVPFNPKLRIGVDVPENSRIYRNQR